MPISFDAIYYDGHTSHRHDVQVLADRDGSLRVQGDGVDLLVRRDDVRISPRLGNTTRSITFRDGAKCETNDNDAVDQLSQMLGEGQTASLVHRLESRWHYAVAAVFLLVAVAAAGMVWGIPAAAKIIASRMPDDIAYQIGDGTLDVLDRTLFDPSELDDETKERIRKAFSGLTQYEQDLPLHLEFRSMGAPNAFALPDGTVVTTDELIELSTDDAQILAVLAHEIGHVKHRHGLRMALESASVALLVSVYLGDASQMSTLMATLPAAYTEANYSRGHETEADIYALELMSNAGIAPHHFADIMEKLSAQYEELTGKEPTGDEEDDELAVFRYLSSHPPTKDRIARFRAAGR